MHRWLAAFGLFALFAALCTAKPALTQSMPSPSPSPSATPTMPATMSPLAR